MVALVAVVVLTFGFVVKSNRDADINTCKETNEVRHQLDSKWDGVSDFLGHLGIGNDPDEGEEREFLALLKEDLEQTDCSKIGYFG